MSNFCFLITLQTLQKQAHEHFLVLTYSTLEENFEPLSNNQMHVIFHRRAEVCLRIAQAQTVVNYHRGDRQSV